MNRHTKGFVLSALIYFLAGSSLGLVSVIYPDLAQRLRPAHAHINLLGWVSMMIMGVSYFVIPVFVRKEPYSDLAVTIHLVLANLGIIGMVTSFILWNFTLLAISALTEMVSAYLFLFNIISTAIKGRPVEAIPAEGRFLTAENDPEVDRWASYFTQAATLYFIIGCTLGGYMAISSDWGLMKVHFHLNLLGWVTMMIFGVAYHIFPRFSGRPVLSGRMVRTNFILANIGLLLMAGALIFSAASEGAPLASHMISVGGIIEGISGLIFIFNILPSVINSGGVMGRASVRFVTASLSYLMLGIILGLFMAISKGHIEPLLPVHAHINVLGWITMMIYGVGHYIIPAFTGKKLYSQKLAGLQFWIANTGLIGFLALLPMRENAAALITGFASLVLLSALMFIFNIVKSILSGGSEPQSAVSIDRLTND